MAVKQNNAEENNSGAVRPDPDPVIESTIQQNISDSDTIKAPSNNKKNLKRKDNPEPRDDEQSNNSKTDQINSKKLQILIEYFYKIAHNKNLATSIGPENVIVIAKELLNELACCVLPSDPKQLKNFKTDIQQVGEIFMKVGENNEKYFYLNYLKHVITIITAKFTYNSDRNVKDFEKYPSCAIAIIFGLFPEALISDAVLFLFSDNNIFNTDDSIIRIVKFLSIWLRQCTFVTHLNVWILSILNQVREQRKYKLLIDIMCDIIEPLFISLIIPILRPKVYPIIFGILTSIKDTPIILHKIISRAPKVVKQLKNELMSNEVEETRKIYQELIALIAVLMEYFPDSNNLYKDMEEVLSDCNISRYYRVMLEKSISGSYSVTLSNLTNAKVGLVNLGNTCYMNSVIQALLCTTDFCRELLLADIKSSLMIKVQQLFAQLLHSRRSELTPTTVLGETRPPSFSPGSQQDSSEFLDYLLETFHEQEINLLMKLDENLQETFDDNDDVIFDKRELDRNKINLNLPNNDNVQMETDSDDNHYVSATISSTANLLPPKIPLTSSQSQQDSSQISINKITIIDKIFTGVTVYTYICLTCKFKSNIHDKFRDLPLSYPEKITNNSQENYTVQELLDHYCSPEILNGENQYYCDKCKKHCDAELIKDIINAPKNLILTLKQFKYDKNNHMRAKLMHKVFHNENITLKIFNTNGSNTIINNEKNTDENLINDLNIIYCNYELYAAVVHTGFSMDSGHYYTYATDNNEWYKFNDNIVTVCRITELHKLSPPNTPYILFYRMQSKSTKICIDTTENISIEHIEIPKSPTFDELPSNLKEIISKDNLLFIKESKQVTTMDTRSITRRGKDDEDDNQPPSNCGGNAMDININNYIF